jgi:hypothetical protein
MMQSRTVGGGGGAFARRLASFFAAFSVLITGGIQAATLLPGSSLVPPPYGLGPAGGLVLASSTVPFAAPLSLSGTLVSKVITNDPASPFSSGLTFTYEITMDNVSGAQPAGLFTVSSYAGFNIDVCYTNGTVSFGVVPDSIARVTIGDTLRFSFAPGGNPTLGPGVNSVLLVVRTDAQTWQSTVGGVIDGNTASVTTYAPSIIPEPSSATLAVVGGATLMCWWVTRRRRN